VRGCEIGRQRGDANALPRRRELGVVVKLRSDRPLVNLLADRFREFWREPGVVFWTFGFPIMLAVVLSLAFREKATETVDAAHPTRRYVDFLMPGLVGMTLLNGGAWGVGFGLILMRTRKLLKRLAATPMHRADLLLAFVLFRVLLSLIETGVLLGLGALLFSTRIGGSIVDLTVIVVLAGLSFAGLGLLCASRAQNPQTGNGWVNLATLPMFLVSGVFFESRNFPDWLKPWIEALPLTACNDALRAIVQEGKSIAEVVPQCGVLALWGGVTFTIALRVFRWT
jgi:ABC-2 type transport system permease protein